MSEPAWRVFIGDWDGVLVPGDYAVLDARGLPWEQARDLLVDKLERTVADLQGDCGDCHATAIDGIARLRAMAPGTAFGDCFVDGDAYVLAPDDT